MIHSIIAILISSKQVVHIVSHPIISYRILSCPVCTRYDFINRFGVCSTSTPFPRFIILLFSSINIYRYSSYIVYFPSFFLFFTPAGPKKKDGYDDGDARGLSSSAPGLPPPPPPSSVPPSLTVDDASDGGVSATTKKKKESPVGAEKGSSGGGGVTEGQLGEQGTRDQKTKYMETLVRGRGGVKDRGDGEDGLFEPSLQSPPSSALPMELPRSRKRSHDHSRAWSTSPPPAHLARCHRLQQQQQQQQSNASLALRLLGADAEQPGEKGDVGGGVRGRGVAGIGVKNDPASPVRMSSREAVFRGVAAQPNGRRVEDRYDGHGDGARARYWT